MKAMRDDGVEIIVYLRAVLPRHQVHLSGLPKVPDALFPVEGPR
jgi:hypothetical protein